MRLGLGTVQFGMPYGVTGRAEKTPVSEVRRILEAAREMGIDLLDTAPEYGDSESVLGEVLQGGRDFKVVTKAPHFRDSARFRARDRALTAAVDSSLAALRRDSVDGLLLHHADDVLAPYASDLLREMEALRDAGKVRKIGISVYSAAELDGFIDLDRIDLVQLPLNILDQRLIHSGHLAKIKSKGIEIHIRSVFLQGVLLADPLELPTYLDPIRESLCALRDQLAEAGISPIAATMAFLNSIAEVDYAVVGVHDLEQLREIRADMTHTPRQALREMDFSCFAIENARILEPRHWPQRVQAS